MNKLIVTMCLLVSSASFAKVVNVTSDEEKFKNFLLQATPLQLAVFVENSCAAARSKSAELVPGSSRLECVSAIDTIVTARGIESARMAVHLALKRRQENAEQNAEVNRLVESMIN